jgi:magnesium chelatase subunit D
MLSEAVDRRGHYVSARPQERVTNVAIDASLRAAAPHQIKRGRQFGEPLKLQPDDLRQKVREHKVGSLVVFVIDGSASMDANNRMATAKTVILNLLHDAYVRRDRVAAIVFRGRSAETILQPTSSVSLARHHLERLVIGGTTPLPHGLLAAYKLINQAKRQDPTVRPLLVLVSMVTAMCPWVMPTPRARASTLPRRSPVMASMPSSSIRALRPFETKAL